MILTSDSLADVDLGNPINYGHQLARGLVGFWLPLPSLSGGMKLYDLTLLRNHGTLTNMDPRTDWVQTDRGIALDFDGVNDYVLVDDSHISTTYPVTVSVWANPIAWQAYSIIFTSDVVGFSVGTHTGGNGEVVVRATTGLNSDWRTDIGNILTDGEWAHIAAVLDSTNGVREVWIDGISRTDTGGTGWDILAGTILGARAGTQYPFAGRLADVIVYDRALASAEIRWLYEDSLSGRYEFLNRRRRWWPVAAGVTYNAATQTATASIPGLPVQKKRTLEIVL